MMKRNEVEIPLSIGSIERSFKDIVIDMKDINDKLHVIFNKSKLFVYAPRRIRCQSDIEDQFPNINDIIVGKVEGMRNDENGNVIFKIILIDSLFYAKLNDPVITISGYTDIVCEERRIVYITRLTLNDRFLVEKTNPV